MGNAIRPYLLDEDAQLRIAAAIKKHLHSIGKSRKEVLYEQGLSQSTIDKALAGEMSEGTLARIEAILGTSFSPKDTVFSEQADDALGSYTLRSVEHLQGDYLVVRPCFSNAGRLNVYGLSIQWDENDACLVFQEHKRPVT